MSRPRVNPSAAEIEAELARLEETWLPPSDRWEISAWGRNLTDETYSRINNRNFLQSERTIWGAPRTYGVNVSWFMN
mgnify:CR=1 FL=1